MLYRTPYSNNSGVGGQRAQMEKTSDVVGKALYEKNLKRGRKQAEPSSRPLDNAPPDLPDNDMAPPPTRKRIKVVIFERYTKHLLNISLLSDQ